MRTKMNCLSIFFLLIFLFCGFTSDGWAKDPIKIGAFFALSGPAANIGTPTKLVAQMVVDKINKEGGVNGRPILLVIGDTESDPTKALMVAKKMVETDKIVALVGPTRTDSGMAVKPYIEQAEIPTVMTVGGDPVIMVPPFKWTFKSPQRSSTMVKKVFEYMKARGTKEIAILTSSDGFGKDGKIWMNKFSSEYGISVVADETFDPKDTDMTSQLTKIRSTGAQAIFCWTIGPAGAIIAKNVKQLGIMFPLYQCGGLADPKYIELAGDASEGNMFTCAKLMVEDQLRLNDPQKAVCIEFKNLYNNTYKFDKTFPINTHSGYAWDAINIIVNAMKKVGTDKYKLRDGIEDTKNYAGISGIYNITPEDHNGLGLNSLVIAKIENHKFKLISY
jgi:branched-chain amino acid transport system substrate-binding protein